MRKKLFVAQKSYAICDFVENLNGQTKIEIWGNTFST